MTINDFNDKWFEFDNAKSLFQSMVGLLNGIFIGLTVFSLLQWQFYSDPANQKPVGERYFNENHEFWLTILIVVGLIALVILCITLFLFKRIRLGGFLN